MFTLACVAAILQARLGTMLISIIAAVCRRDVSWRPILPLRAGDDNILGGIEARVQS